HMVAEDERQRVVSSENAKPLDSAAFKAFQRKIALKEGHRREGCFKIIGYPDWWPEKKGDKSRGKAAYVETEISPILGLSNDDYQTFLKHFSRTGTTEEELDWYGEMPKGTIQDEDDSGKKSYGHHQ
nr:hypothetical protein [Tanacetum cinerariifolium]